MFLIWPIRLVTNLLNFLFGLLVLASCILTIMALMGEKGWIWSLTTHFRLQYLVIQLIALLFTSVVFWLQRGQPGQGMTWVTLLFLMFFSGLNGVQIAPYYMPRTPAQTGPEKIKLMHINLFGYLNQDQKKVIAAIRETNPDIMDLVEYTEPWQRRLEHSGVLARYPYHIAVGEHIGLYSKFPLRNARLVYADPQQKVTNQANIIAQFKLNQKPVTLLVAHPASPILPSHLNWQKTSFDAWIQHRRKQPDDNFIIVGDLNTTPWSREFEALLRETRLRDSQLGFGLQPSWPAFLPALYQPKNLGKLAKYLPLKEVPWLQVAGIPIDHILVSERVEVLSRQTGPFVGSDHLPVIAELALKHP